jgi:hypothetical protein
MSASTVVCTRLASEDRIHFEFEDGLRTHVSFEDAARNSILQNAIEAAHPDGDASFEMSLPCDILKSWIAATELDLPGCSAQQIAEYLEARFLAMTVESKTSCLIWKAVHKEQSLQACGCVDESCYLLV